MQSPPTAGCPNTWVAEQLHSRLLHPWQPLWEGGGRSAGKLEALVSTRLCVSVLYQHVQAVTADEKDAYQRAPYHYHCCYYQSLLAFLYHGAESLPKN